MTDSNCRLAVSIKYTDGMTEETLASRYGSDQGVFVLECRNRFEITKRLIPLPRIHELTITMQVPEHEFVTYHQPPSFWHRIKSSVLGW